MAKDKHLTSFEEQTKLHSSGVELRNLVKRFPGQNGEPDTLAVNNINLNIEPGKMITLLGPSGCGKTTVLRMISGFESPTSGEIFIGEQPMQDVPPNKRNISMVFQSYALFPHLTIYENICYGLRVQKLPEEEIKHRTEAVFALMRLEGLENRVPSQLSGGQQQRVSLARAVIIEPKVLLFDEPLSNLDAKLREYMRDEVRAIQQRLGITSLYVTHDQSEAMAISDQVMIMESGIVQQIGDPETIYEYPVNQFIANFIGKANFIPCVLEEKDGESAVVNLKGHRYRVPNPGAMEGVQVGGDANLSVRPESISLVKEGEGFDGEVTRAVYYGDRIEYEVKMTTGTLSVDVYNPQMKPRFYVGDAVKVAFDDICVRVLS